MPTKPQRKVEVFGTSIMSSNKIRSNHDKVTRILSQAKVAFEFYDISASEERKIRYKKLVASNHVKSPELPFLISGGEVVGTVEQLEEAVEFGELRQFLLLDKPPGQSEDDELLSQLSPAELKELSGTIAGSSNLTAQKVADEVQDLTGTGSIERPIEPVSTPVNLVPSITPLRKEAPHPGERGTLLSQMNIGKDEVEMKKEQNMNSKAETREKMERDIPALDAASSSIGEKIQEKIEANSTAVALPSE